MTSSTTIYNGETNIVADELSVLARNEAVAAAAAAAASAIEANDNGAAQVALAAAQVTLATEQADRAESEADRAAAGAAIVDVAGGVLAIRDATLVYKEQAEAAAEQLPGIGDQVAADRLAVSQDRIAAEAARNAAQAVVTTIIPIAQEALITGFDGVLIGPGAVEGALNDSSTVIGFNAGTGNVSQKLTAYGQSAGVDFAGYAPALMGVFAGRDSAVNHLCAVGTHAGQNLNKRGDVVPGFGNFASGTVTFTGLPSDGDTVTLNGIAFTARTAPATAYEFAIGASAAATVTNLFARIAAANDDALKDAYYRPGVSANANRIEIIAAGRGAWGNAFTLATTSGSVAISGATLSGGTDYTVPQTPANAGGAVMGFLAYRGGYLGAARAGHGWLSFVSNPADGDTLVIGNNATTLTFRTTASAGTDIQIGADATATAVNTLAVLRAQGGASFTVADYYFWRHVLGPRIYIVYKTTSGSTSFRVRSNTAAVTGTGLLFGEQLAVGVPSTVLGQSTGEFSVGGGNTLLTVAGYAYQGTNSFVAGDGAGFLTTSSNSFIFAPNGARQLRGDNLIVIGAAIANGAQQDWKRITGISSSGVITFQERHGWPVGEFISATQRNTTNGSNLIKRDGVNLPTAGNTIFLRALTSRTAVIFDQKTSDSPPWVFSISGNPTEIELARSLTDVTTAVAIGRGAALQSFTMNFGSALYTGGAIFRGGVLQNPDNGIAFSSSPTVPSAPTSSVGPAAQGFVAISGAIADGSTITANGVVFTFRTAPSGATNEVLIGATARDSALNFINVFNAVDPNVTASRLHRHARVSLERLSASTWYVRFVCQEYSGNTYTLAVSGANLAVSGATLTGSNMGTTPAPLSVPNGTIVRIQHHPKNNGLVGLAMADHANNRWQFL